MIDLQTIDSAGDYQWKPCSPDIPNKGKRRIGTALIAT